MPMTPGKLANRFKPCPPRCDIEMIMPENDPAAGRQPADRSFQTVVIALVGEQPDAGPDRGQIWPRRLGQNRAGLVSQHKQAYRRKLGERE